MHVLVKDPHFPLARHLSFFLSFFELQLEIKQLEEQLKQSEEEKQKLQVDLGKHLFLEEKGKRHGRLLGGAALLHESG